MDLTGLKDIDFSQTLEIILPDSVTPDLVLALNMIVTSDISVIYVRSDEKCPCCGNKLTFKEYRPRHPNNLDNVKVKKYRCGGCGKTFYPDFSSFTLFDHKFSFNVMHWYAKLSEILAVPFEKASELFESLFNVYISPSTLFNHYDIVSNEYYQSQEDLLEEEVEENELKDKGIYHHDEHFPHQNGIGMVNLVILDAQTLYPYKGVLDYESNFDSELLSKYFHEVLDDIPHEIMITGGYSAYPSIIQDLGMLQQRCVFHMIYNAGMMIYPLIRRFLKNNRGKYTKLENTNQKLKNALSKYDPKVGHIAKADKKRRHSHDLIVNLEKEIQKHKTNN